MTKRATHYLPVLVAVTALGCGDRTSTLDQRIDAVFGDLGLGTLNRDQARRLLETPPEADRPFYMVNLVRHRPRAEYADGRETELTGAQANALYGAVLLPIFAEIGARPIYNGNVERILLPGDGAQWTQVAIVLYPSRAAFVAMLERPDFRAAEVHKRAGVERTIILVSEPAAGQAPEELRRLDLTALPFPPTPMDRPINVIHVLDFNATARYADGRPSDLTGRQAMELYEQGRIPQALPLGARPGITLEVEGELIGDGRPWEEVRLNNFPSRAALAELIEAESLTAAGYEHRAAGLADTYALVAAPLINEVGYLPPRMP